MRHATYNMSHATCNMQHATCKHAHADRNAKHRSEHFSRPASRAAYPAGRAPSTLCLCAMHQPTPLRRRRRSCSLNSACVAKCEMRHAKCDMRQEAPDAAPVVDVVVEFVLRDAQAEAVRHARDRPHEARLDLHVACRMSHAACCVLRVAC